MNIEIKQNSDYQIKFQEKQTQTEIEKKSQIIQHSLDNVEYLMKELKYGFRIYNATDAECSCRIETLNKWTQTQINLNFVQKTKKQKPLSTQKVPITQNIDNKLQQELAANLKIITHLSEKVKHLETKLSTQIQDSDQQITEYREQLIPLQIKVKELSKQIQEQDIIFEQKLEQESQQAQLEKQAIQVRYKNQVNKLQNQIQDFKQQNGELIDSLKEQNMKIQQMNQSHFIILLTFNMKKQKYEEKINELQTKLEEEKIKQEELIQMFENRQSRQEDIQRIEELEIQCKKLEEALLLDYRKVEKANQIVKYLQIELENYKKQYNIFSNKKVTLTSRKTFQQFSTSQIQEDDDNKSLILDQNEFPQLIQNEFPQLIQKEFPQGIHSDQKQSQSYSQGHKLQDFEIKKHKIQPFFKTNKRYQLNITPQRYSQPKKYHTYRKSYANPFENDNIILHAGNFLDTLKQDKTFSSAYNNKSNNSYQMLLNDSTREQKFKFSD